MTGIFLILFVTAFNVSIVSVEVLGAWMISTRRMAGTAVCGDADRVAGQGGGGGSVGELGRRD